MITRIQKWGNSQGVRISKELLEAMSIKTGDSVELSVGSEGLLVTPVRRVRGTVDLAELVAAIPAGYTTEDDFWGEPQGGEVW